MPELDTRRNEVLGKSAIIIQGKVRSYYARKKFLLLRASAIQVQAVCRGMNLLDFYISYTTTCQQKARLAVSTSWVLRTPSVTLGFVFL